MKKYFLLIAGLIVLLFAPRGIAQHSAAEEKKFKHNMTADSDDSWSYNGIRFWGDEFSKYGPKFDVWIKPHSTDNDYLSQSLTGSIITAQLYNATILELATTSITPVNAIKYQYRLVADNSLEVLPWTTPSVFRSNKFTSYAYLGKFSCRYKTLKLIIAEKSNKSNESVYVYNNDNIPQVKVRSIVVQYPTGFSGQNASDWNKGFGVWLAKNIESINLDIDNTSKNELYHVYLKKESNGIMTPVGNNWEHVFNSPNPTMYINSSFFKEPGKYTIIIRPEVTTGENNSLTIGAAATAHFTVFAGPKNIPLKTVIAIILVLMAATAINFALYRRAQKRKLAREAQARQIATLQLQSVRAQLNPHFIFNALAGIQNLMNKNAVEDANKYLTRFARLTRNVLDDSQKELISIEQETALLDDYLQMEQTRFGFKFNITVDTTIDRQTEIPAMLLQPFAENAIKHAISALKNNGLVTININKSNNDIILTIQDNGPGFNENQTNGMGIKLCRDRIDLFNSIYKNTTILLHIKTNGQGTLITIELKNWL